MDSGTPPRTDEEVRETIQQARQARIQRELRQDFDKQLKSSHDASRTECEVDFDDWMKLPTQREFARAIGKEFDKWVKSQREAGLSKAVIAQALWKAPRIIQQERDKCAANGKLASFERLMQAQTGKRDVEIAEEILARQETLRTAFAYWVTVKPNWPESLDEAEETIEQARAASMQRGMENQFDDWKAKQREWSDAKGRFETNSDFEIAHSLRTGVKTILEEREKCECEGSLPEFEAWLAQALKEKLDVEIAEELRDAKEWVQRAEDIARSNGASPAFENFMAEAGPQKLPDVLIAEKWLESQGTLALSTGNAKENQAEPMQDFSGAPAQKRVGRAPDPYAHLFEDSSATEEEEGPVLDSFLKWLGEEAARRGKAGGAAETVAGKRFQASAPLWERAHTTEEPKEPKDVKGTIMEASAASVIGGQDKKFKRWLRKQDIEEMKIAQTIWKSQQTIQAAREKSKAKGTLPLLDAWLGWRGIEKLDVDLAKELGSVMTTIEQELSSAASNASVAPDEQKHDWQEYLALARRVAVPPADTSSAQQKQDALWQTVIGADKLAGSPSPSTPEPARNNNGTASSEEELVISDARRARDDRIAEARTVFDTGANTMRSSPDAGNPQQSPPELPAGNRASQAGQPARQDSAPINTASTTSLARERLPSPAALNSPHLISTASSATLNRIRSFLHLGGAYKSKHQPSHGAEDAARLQQARDLIRQARIEAKAALAPEPGESPEQRQEIEQILENAALSAIEQGKGGRFGSWYAERLRSGTDSDSQLAERLQAAPQVIKDARKANTSGPLGFLKAKRFDGWVKAQRAGNLLDIEIAELLTLQQTSLKFMRDTAIAGGRSVAKFDTWLKRQRRFQCDFEILDSAQLLPPPLQGDRNRHGHEGSTESTGPSFDAQLRAGER